MKKLMTIVAMLTAALSLTSRAGWAAAVLRPRPLGFYAGRQVPLLAQPETVGTLLPAESGTAPSASAAPSEDEELQALRESGLDAEQIREVAALNRARRDRVARRAQPAADDKDEVARKDKAAKKKELEPRSR